MNVLYLQFTPIHIITNYNIKPIMSRTRADPTETRQYAMSEMFFTRVIWGNFPLHPAENTIQRRGFLISTVNILWANYEQRENLSHYACHCEYQIYQIICSQQENMKTTGARL